MGAGVRVLFSTTAGAGHFAPMVPFARACLTGGYDVRIAAPGSFASTVTGAGFDHVAFDDADPAEIGAVFSQLHLGTVHDANIRVVREIFGRIDALAALPGLASAVDSWRPDVIVAEVAEFGSALVADQRGIRQLRVNIGLDSFTDEVLDAVDEPLRALGCPSGSDSVRAAPRLSLVPAGFDHVTNPAVAVHRFRDATASLSGRRLPAQWWPKESSDQPLVYATFGSVAGQLGFFPDFYRRVVDIVADLPVRVLMTLGAGLDPADLGAVPPNVHVESWVPQEEVLGEAAVVVHHGGFGTLITTLAHARPQVVIPLFSADQYANAEQVATIGVGVSLSPGPTASLRSADLVPTGPDLGRLAESLTYAVTSGQLLESAATVAADLASLPPAAEFLELLGR